MSDGRIRLDLVLSVLRTAEDGASITGVTRALQKDHGGPAHRLTVAGYLQALEHMGFVEAVPDPPAKKYVLLDERSRWPHARVRAAVERVGVSPMNACAAVVQVLQAILGRPIFQMELQLAGYGKPGRNVKAASVDPSDRRRYRSMVEAATGGLLQVPHGDDLLEAHALGSADVQEILVETLRVSHPDLEGWYRNQDDPDDTVQTRLRVADSS